MRLLCGALPHARDQLKGGLLAGDVAAADCFTAREEHNSVEFVGLASPVSVHISVRCSPLVGPRSLAVALILLATSESRLLSVLGVWGGGHCQSHQAFYTGKVGILGVFAG